MSGPPPTVSADRDPVGPLPPDAPAGRPDPSHAPRGRSEGLGAVPAWAAVLATALAIVVVPSLALLPVLALELVGVEVDLESPPPGFIIPATLLLDVGLVVIACLVARAFGVRIRPSTFGVRSVPVRRALIWSAAVYAGFWAAALVYAFLLGKPPEQALVEDLRAQDSLLVLGGFALMVGVAAPLAEEVFFRGFLFGALRERIGVLAAALVAGAIFGVIHAGSTPVRTLGILVILGIGLCFLYYKTHSLLPCMALHSLNNSIALAATKEVEPVVGVLLVGTCVAVTMVVATLVVRSEPEPASA